jgi:hypothetical protein
MKVYLFQHGEYVYKMIAVIADDIDEAYSKFYEWAEEHSIYDETDYVMIIPITIGEE